MHVGNVQNIDICPFKKHSTTGTALHTNKILQYLVLDKIVITFTAKHLIKFVLISTWISVMNMRICDVLLNFFVSVYISSTSSINSMNFQGRMSNSRSQLHETENACPARI